MKKNIYTEQPFEVFFLELQIPFTIDADLSQLTCRTVGSSFGGAAHRSVRQPRKNCVLLQRREPPLVNAAVDALVNAAVDAIRIESHCVCECSGT